MKWMAMLFLTMGFNSAFAADLTFVDLPQGCFSKSHFPCQIRASVGFLSFEKGGNLYHLGEKSSLLLNSASEVQLMQGQLWVQDSHDLTFKSSSALKMIISGDWFFEKVPDSNLLVRNLNGDMKFDSKFVFANEALPIGFQNWFAGLDSHGQISRGVIRPIAEVDFLRSWIPLSGYSMAELRKKFYSYREMWAGALSKSADLYQEVVERRLASQDEKLKRAADRLKAQKSEQENLREMYRRKNGLGEADGL
jgi:hypothetical protein